jgi:glycosyltransferase involved in cell wall biosynthesis
MQDVEWISKFGKFFGNIFIFVSRLLLGFYKNSKIVTVSPSSRSELVQKGFNEKNISLAFNGIDNAFFRTAQVKKTFPPIKLLFLGRQAKTKRTLLGLELIKRYHKNNPDISIQVDIIGIGEAMPMIKEIVEKCDFPINLHGRASDENKIMIASEAHLQIQLAQKEGWGITTIEAASRGVPTLCLNVPGLRDSVLPSTGYIAQSEDYLLKTLEQAITDILENSENYTHKCVNAITWSEQFTWEQCVLAIEKVITE